MKRLLLLTIFVSLASLVFSQLHIWEKPESHDYYLKLLNNSKDSIYQNVLRIFDEYCLENPSDYLTRIERCKFIGWAYYDYYEEYNPKEDECQQCIGKLLLDFPGNPEVLVYKSEQVYGDSAAPFLQRVG